MRTTLATFVWCGVLGLLLLPGCGPKETPKAPANKQEVTDKGPLPPPTKPAATDSSKMAAAGADKVEAGKTAGAETPPANLYPYEELVSQAGDPGLTAAYKKSEDDVRANPAENDLKMQRIYLLSTAGEMFMEQEKREQGNAAFRAALELAQQLIKDVPDPPDSYRRVLATVYYNGACTQSMDGKAEAAKETLGQAVAWGFNDMDSIKNDPDLANVRALAGFDVDLAKWIEQARQAMMKMAREELAKGVSFPFDLQVDDLAGTQIKLADYKGKVLIVDFWGTWCPPCRAEIPSFVKLQDQYGPQGLQIVGLNFENGDPEEAKTKVEEFIKANKMNYPCALGTDELQSQVPEFEGFPTTVFIDKTGKVRLKIVGLHEYGFLESVVQVLLEEPAPAGAAPAETPPAETAPPGTAPAETTPPGTAPTEKAPAEKTPAEKTPAESAGSSQ